MKRFVFAIIFLIAVISSNATHIAGGELYYERIGAGTTANSDRYKITMRLFRQCDNTGGTGAQLSIETPKIGIYNTNGLSLLYQLQLTAQFTTVPTLSNTPSANPCLTGTFAEINSCYQIGTWSGEIELPRTADGYTLVWTRYTRRQAGVQNVSISTETGATFTTQIPGTNVLPTGFNSSPKFVIRDTALVCKETQINLDYSASDADGDSLVYKFAPAYEGLAGSSSNPDPFTATGPPNSIILQSLNYISPYSATSPLGSSVSLNSSNGVLSGVAPAASGYYVICVVVEEWRDGVKINNHRKDFILKVGNCGLSGAQLDPDRWSCNGFTWNFQNQSSSSNITNYLWSFGDGNSSINPTPTHTYADTGVFKVKLIVTASGGCKDSAMQNLHVFPGFTPAINVVGSCVQQPIQFFDATTTAYGVVNSWKWDFGDLTTLADTSRRKDSSWLYPAAGTYQATLISTNSKGCIDTARKTIVVRDKPIINLPFRDTLICSIDTLPLIANTSGSIVWTPNYNIINANTANPLVYPTDTTTYVVTVNDGGCINKDSIKVNVLTFIRVDAGVDSAICKTDTFRLHPISDALSYIWTASTGVAVDDIKYPLVQPLVYTKYYVTANLGKCQDRDSVAINPVPYPQVSAADVNPICFGGKVQLNANIVGSNFYWRPTNTLLNPTSLNPIAGPSKTTAYIITATDTVGCPKPVSDTIVVEVIPIVSVNAGRDTAIVRNQPLQLFATTNGVPVNTKYLWTPNIGLNSDTIFNPITILNITADSIKYKVRVTRPEGCFGEDEIVVRIFRTEPDIFVPTAFTPNKDGKNDILKPIAVGITQLNFFRIYNRWGQLVFETKELEKGWDGTINGVPQASGTFVFVTQGVDYTGKVIFKKGTCVLIR